MGAWLDQANFEAANLKRSNFAWAYGERVRMRGVKLERAYGYGARLIDSDLAASFASGVVLEYGSLARSDLYSADFSGAALRYLDVTSTRIRSTDLSDANMTRVKLKDAELIGMSNLVGATLVGAFLQGIDFRHWNLDSVDLRYSLSAGTDFRYTNLSNANLTELDWSKRNFTGTRFKWRARRGAQSLRLGASLREL